MVLLLGLCHWVWLVGWLVRCGLVRVMVGGGSPVVGGFGLGDGLEGAITERDGSFQFGLPLGGLTMGWDSRNTGGDDRFGLGNGWGFGLGLVDTRDGTRVFPSSGGVFEVDESHPSGLRDYGVKDLRFEQTPGETLEGRADGMVGEQEIGYVLHELGGVTTYFNGNGNPVARVDGFGNRSDWVWDQGNDRLKVSSMTVVSQPSWIGPHLVNSPYVPHPILVPVLVVVCGVLRGWVLNVSP